MSLGLGNIRQIAFVVKDIESAMRHWVEVLGVGPWFCKENLGITTFSYYGETVDELPHISAAMANSGGMQVELIQVKNDVPSLWRDSLHAGAGFQHFAYWVEDYEEKLAGLLSRGYVVGHSGQAGSSFGRFSYLVHDNVPGLIIELSETNGAKGRYFAEIAQAARDWNGENPIRQRSPSI